MTALQGAANLRGRVLLVPFNSSKHQAMNQSHKQDISGGKNCCDFRDFDFDDE